MSDSLTLYPSLKNRVVFVSGGGSGIGAALVEHFALQGAIVAFCDIDCEVSTALVANLTPRCAHAPVFAYADIRDIGAYQQVLADVEASLGAVRVLVNNAGRDDRHTLAELTPEYWDNCLALNLKHHVFAIQQVAPGMAAAGGGSIINLGSISWMRGRPNLVGYTTSKAGIAGLARTLARELGESNIRVNALAPGAIVTERQAALWRDPQEDQKFIDLQCLKYRLDPGHVARTALFLAADDSNGITGQNIIVDAGLAQVSVAG
ncbi:SDR family NAD(P)-dependent oxidoreductase [Janthinobacterium aquaticum]|uniref:SDR family NAD(P)-dependent oxidoreductase n=1 Tax=Janthinobacterium sp. FT58W TaxID=2654254 RepID=UPI001265A722|nr:SDR family oxidoreductase [Janthinobacterium sp. FT58W]KAB8039266.1 SDR family oxidoreductase [Janthinobacterium sp. FT58W]